MADSDLKFKALGGTRKPLSRLREKWTQLDSEADSVRVSLRDQSAAGREDPAQFGKQAAFVKVAWYR